MSRILQIKNKELTREVLRFVLLPRIECECATFLPFDECQRMMDNGATLKDELCDLKRVLGDFVENDDQHAMSVRLLGAFFSCYAPGHDKGPEKTFFAVQRHIETMDTSVETWFKFTKMRTWQMSQRTAKRQRNLFYFVGRLTCVGLQLRHSTMHQKTIRGKERESTPNIFAVIGLQI